MMNIGDVVRFRRTCFDPESLSEYSTVSTGEVVELLPDKLFKVEFIDFDGFTRTDILSESDLV